MKLSKKELKELDAMGKMYQEGFKDGVLEGRWQVWKEVNKSLEKMGVKSCKTK